jgi:WD40 repeat protein
MENARPNTETLFHRALEFAQGERAAFLSGACGNDLALRQRVEALLAAHGKAKGFLPAESQPEVIPTVLVETAPTEEVGSLIGRYKVLERLGEGGFGAVWLAEQKEPVRRKVALKIIKLGMDSRQVVARFEAERQALALMDHPNIAKVLDAGATDNGRPYFVMELVRGIPITRFCDENRLPTKERLDLFIKVCQAIQHAHQKGIIHRDIKPSNILVTLHDGVPVPKVIDFGIAKATQQELTDKTIHTQFQQFIGTPAYMSPEQAELSGLDIDTRSDIYSLGVLLYELLTGKTPFDAKALLEAGLEEMRRTIREKEPVRPSTRLSAMLEGELTTTARQRGSEAPKLIHLLRGDLDWIVMKALEKDRTRRYETANGLGMDIQRHLQGEAVIARPPSNLYRLQKLVRRNRLAFAAAGAVTLALIAGVLVSTWQAVLAVRAKNQAKASEQKAQQARADEARQRELAQAEAKRAEENAILLKIQRAEDLFAADNSSAALAWLAQVLRQSPTNRLAAQRLISALSQRNFPLPTVEPLKHAGELRFAEFSPDAHHVLTASADNTARVWDARTGLPVTPPLAHAAAVNSARFSPDGQRMVTASADKTARVWDARDGQPISDPLQHNFSVGSADFSPDGSKIATVAGYDPVFIWDSATGKRLVQLVYKGNPTSADFSPDSQRVVTAATSDHTANVWDANSGQMISEVRHDYFVGLARFSADGKRFVTASLDNTARVWDAYTGKALTPPLRHETWVIDAAFSPDGQRVVTHSRDNLARTWDAQTGEPLTHPFKYQPGIPASTSSAFVRYHSVRFTGDGQGVLTANWDNTARLWDSLTGTPLTEPLRHDQEIVSAQLSPTGQQVVTASLDQSARIWDLRQGRMLTEPLEHNAEVTAAQFTPNGQQVVTASEDRTAWIWDVRTGLPVVGPFQHDDFVLAVQVSADGRKVGTASYDHTARIWDAVTGQGLTPLMWHDDVVRSIRFSADGRQVITTSDDGTARIWDASSGKQVTAPLRHESNVVFATFSHDGQRVITASRDKTARVWDVHSGSAVAKPLVHEDAVLSARFSPDGEKVLTASADFTARIWNARTGQLIGEMRHGGRVLTAEFSPDGKLIATASADKTARIWDAETGQARTDSLRHREQVNVASFSPDSRLLVTASADNTARVWDSQTGQPITEILHHGAGVNSAQFSPDGHKLVTASADHSARVWELPLAEVPVPQWLPQLAEALAGQRVGPGGVLEPVSPVELLKVKRELSARTETDAHLQWARWFFGDREIRTISPNSLVTMGEYVRRRTERSRLYSFAGTESFYVVGYIKDQARENRIKHLKEALRLSPTNHLALARLARTVISSPSGPTPREMGEALWYSQRAMELAPEDWEPEWSRAEVLAHSGQLPTALELIERVIQRAPRHPELWNAEGCMFALTNRLSEAYDAFSQAIQLADSLGPIVRNARAEALFNRYLLLRKQNRPVEARLDLRAAKAELVVPVTIPARDPQVKPKCIDLSPQIDTLLTESWSWWPGAAKKMDYGGLPRGIQRLTGVDFDLRGEIFLRMRIPESEQSHNVLAQTNRPLGESASIPIGQKCKKVHFLHVETDGARPTGTQVAYYVVHYDDGQHQEIPLRYGLELANYMGSPKEDDAHLTIAWSGATERTKQFSSMWSGGIRLFKTTWDNPYPDIEIKSLDAVAKDADLHVFAITVE